MHHLQVRSLPPSELVAVWWGIEVGQSENCVGPCTKEWTQLTLSSSCSIDRPFHGGSISSVRTNTVTPKLAAALAQSGTKSLTVAVESGSARMRDVVNKKVGAEATGSHYYEFCTC